MSHIRVSWITHVFELRIWLLIVFTRVALSRHLFTLKIFICHKFVVTKRQLTETEWGSEMTKTEKRSDGIEKKKHRRMIIYLYDATGCVYSTCERLFRIKRTLMSHVHTHNLLTWEYRLWRQIKKKKTEAKTTTTTTVKAHTIPHNTSTTETATETGKISATRKISLMRFSWKVSTTTSDRIRSLLSFSLRFVYIYFMRNFDVDKYFYFIRKLSIRNQIFNSKLNYE